MPCHREIKAENSLNLFPEEEDPCAHDGMARQWQAQNWQERLQPPIRPHATASRPLMSPTALTCFFTKTDLSSSRNHIPAQLLTVNTLSDPFSSLCLKRTQNFNALPYLSP